MKVYELMNELSKMPAGAKVVISGCISENEFKQLDIISTDEQLRELHKTAVEVEEDDDVLIYF